MPTWSGSRCAKVANDLPVLPSIFGLPQLPWFALTFPDFWDQNPFMLHEVVASPLNLMSDAHFGYSMGGTQTFVNSGFAYMAPEAGTLSFMREVVRLLKKA